MLQNRLFVALASRSSSLAVVLGSDSWKLRLHMRRDEMRRDELGSGEKSSDKMKCGVWRVQCEVWGVKSAVWSVECEVWSVDCEVWSVKCEVWTVKCEVWSVKCGVCSGKRAVWSVECEVWSVKCEVWSVQCAEWSVKSAVCSVECKDCQVWSVTWSFKCDMWNKTPVSQSARTHGLRWRTAHASSIDEKGLIYIFKATSAPPRAGTTGIWFSIINQFCNKRLEDHVHIAYWKLYFVVLFICIFWGLPSSNLTWQVGKFFCYVNMFFFAAILKIRRIFATKKV